MLHIQQKMLLLHHFLKYSKGFLLLYSIQIGKNEGEQRVWYLLRSNVEEDYGYLPASLSGEWH